MSDSIVSASEIRAFKAAIQSYSTGSENTLRQFDLQIRPIMRRFEEKLDMLEEIRNEKYRALSSCHERQKYNDDISCSSQEREFAIASGRYHECLGLIREARAAIQQFKSKSEAYRATTTDLVSRAKSGLERVEDMISKYSSQTGASATAIPEAGPILSSSGMESAIHISGGDRIASVISRSTGKSAVVIDPEAMARKLDNLPPVSDPDSQTMRTAALGIIALLAGGGLAVGSKEMILQQKADEIFEQQYGISRTEMLLASGHKRNEYVNAYNNIHKGLRKEIIEVQKTTLKDTIKRIDDEIAKIKDKDSLWAQEKSYKLEIDKQNLENELNVLEYGKKKTHIPYDQTVVAGVSSKGLEYMMREMSPGRFTAIVTYLAHSDFRLVEHGIVPGAYQFTDNEYHIGISKDGKTLTIQKAASGWAQNIDFKNIEIEGALTNSINYERDFNGKSFIENDYSEGISLTYTPVEVHHDYMNYEYKSLYISEDGTVTSNNISLKSRIGPKTSLSAEAEAGTGGAGFNLKATASIAESSLNAEIHEQPFIFGDKIVMMGCEMSAGGNLGGELNGNYEFSEKGASAKLKASGLLSAGASGRITVLSLKDLPESVAQYISESTPRTSEMAKKWALNTIERTNPFHAIYERLNK